MMNTVCFLPLKNLSESSVRTPPRDKISSLYCLKAICAFIVVLIHSQSWGSNVYTYPLLGLAVPCFFAIGGYFLYSDTQEKECRKAQKQLKKALKYLIFYTCLYAVFYILYSNARYVWQTIPLTLVTGKGTSIHLWYLAALWQALLLFLVLRRFFRTLYLFIPLLILLQSAMLWGLSFSPLASGWYDCQFFIALCCILNGYTIHQHQKRLTAIPSWVPALIFLFCIIPYESMGLIAAKSVLIPNICRVSGSFAIVLFCIKHQNAPCKMLENIGEKHSANIYFYHIIIRIVTVDLMMHCFGVDINNYAAYLVFLLGIPFSIALRAGQSLITRTLKGSNTASGKPIEG